MTYDTPPSTWDFDAAISLLNSFSPGKLHHSLTADLQPKVYNAESGGDAVDLGNFSSLWDYLGSPRNLTLSPPEDFIKYEVNEVPVAEFDPSQLNRGVRWRDEVDGADLEDNVEPVKSTASQRTLKRAARRAKRAKAQEEAANKQNIQISDTGTDAESGEELESLRRSPDRRSVIENILGRSRPGANDSNSPPTSPSPPKAEVRTPKRDWPVANPFLWTAPGVPSPSHRLSIGPQDGLEPRQRKEALIKSLLERCPDERKYLKNSGLLEPSFTPLNVSNIGVHVFIDISNISIGFHDCLKLKRGISRESHVRRIPMSFHNFSLVLERGRPAAKRVLAGSDKSTTVTKAKNIGYETSILERVNKVKELTPRQKKYRSGGETSGSETNTRFLSAQKWVEQGVDEILHMKILESLVDAEKPSTIVLATGDAAEAEYSGGFLRMVERALEKGWMVELVSFRLNTSSLYKRKEFRAKWGPMFKWIQLDDYVEMLIDEEED